MAVLVYAGGAMLAVSSIRTYIMIDDSSRALLRGARVCASVAALATLLISCSIASAKLGIPCSGD